MKIEIHIHHHHHVHEGNHSITTKIQQMSDQLNQELEVLRQKVEENNAVDQAGIILLQGLKEKLDAAIAAQDLTKLRELSASLGQSTSALAAAIAANTPSAPPAGENGNGEPPVTPDPNLTAQ